MIFARRASTLPLLVAAAMLLDIAAAPPATLPSILGRHLRRCHHEEHGEIVQNILWVAGFAAIAIAVVAIIRTFVLAEAENLPTSGTVRG